AGQCKYEVTVTTPAGEVTLPLSVPAQAGAGNVATAWSALVSLGLAPDVAKARAALANFAVEGRFERMRAAGRDWLFDGAHNVAATAFLIEAVRHAYPGRDLTLVFGCMSDKDAQQMLAMWRPHLKRILCTRALSHRATDLTDLSQVARAAGIAEVISAPILSDLPELAVALTAADTAPLVLVTGSFYLVGDLLAVLSGR
ncbi:MAG: glutamate ligase domain-containing protein, partial [Planctomycetota bacterium]